MLTERGAQSPGPYRHRRLTNDIGNPDAIDRSSQEIVPRSSEPSPVVEEPTTAEPRWTRGIQFSLRESGPGRNLSLMVPSNVSSAAVTGNKITSATGNEITSTPLWTGQLICTVLSGIVVLFIE
jgi:hypothetical protein